MTNATYRALDASRAWFGCYMVDRKDFQKEVSPLWNPDLTTYSHALIANDCWQSHTGSYH
jgi:hypothetical protein